MSKRQDPKSDGAHSDGVLIDELGGTGVVAKFLGIADASVSEWRVRGIPELRRLQLKVKLEAAGRPVPKRLANAAA